MVLSQLQEALAYNFQNLDWLQLAITHSSWANEANMPQMHNERLEFLGDAVLELCVSAELFRRYPDLREGRLTMIRTYLVGEKTLAELARKIGLDKFIRLGLGEEKQKGRERNSLLADAMEATLAAVFQDGGFKAACAVIGRLYEDLWPKNDFEKESQSYKSRLQEICQHLFGQIPRYDLVNTERPDCAKVFEVELTLPDGAVFRAKASAIKKAQQLAAGMALDDYAKKGVAGRPD